MSEQIRFTTRVLGAAAAYRLENRQVTQTLRSESDSIANAILLGRVSTGDRLEVLLNSILVGRVLDTALVEAHSVYASLGMNGGQRCDVVSGPCACGAWH